MDLCALTIIFPPPLVAPLTAAEKKLCIARQVASRYTVVWSTFPIAASTVLTWNDTLQAFYTEEAFESGKKVSSPDSANIAKGQTLTVDSEGKMAVSGEGDPSSDHFVVKNHYSKGGIRFGLNAPLLSVPPKDLSPIPFFVQRYATIPGHVNIYPQEKVLVWLGDKDVEAGSLFTAASEVCEVDLAASRVAVVANAGVGWILGDLTSGKVVGRMDWKGDDGLQPSLDPISNLTGEDQSSSGDKASDKPAELPKLTEGTIPPKLEGGPANGEAEQLGL